MKTTEQLIDEAAQLNLWIEHCRTHRSNLQSAAQMRAMIEAEEDLRAILKEINNREI